MRDKVSGKFDKLSGAMRKLFEKVPKYNFESLGIELDDASRALQQTANYKATCMDD
jgi:hypothetical protein